MSYLKGGSQSLIEPLKKGRKVLKLAIWRNVTHPPIPPQLVSHTFYKDLVPIQILEPMNSANVFSISTLNYTISSYDNTNRTLTFSNVTISGEGNINDFNPFDYGMIVIFKSGNSSTSLSGEATLIYDTTYTFSINASPFTLSYSASDWDVFMDEEWSAEIPGYTAFEEDILYEKTQNFIWGSRIRDGQTLSPDDIRTTEYVRNSYLELVNDYAPSKVYLNKQGFVYLGYGPRNEWGLTGTTVQHIYDIYMCEVGDEPTPTYGWTYQGEVEFIGTVTYEWYAEDVNIGKQLSVASLNTSYPPNASLDGKLIGDLLTQDYIQVSPGTYQYYYKYGVYKCVRIS